MPTVPVVWSFSTSLIWLQFNEADTFTLHIMNPPVTSLTFAVSVLTRRWGNMCHCIASFTLIVPSSLYIWTCNFNFVAFTTVVRGEMLASEGQPWRSLLWVHNKVYKQAAEMSLCSYIFSWALYLYRCNNLWHFYIHKCLLCLLPIADKTWGRLKEW